LSWFRTPGGGREDAAIASVGMARIAFQRTLQAFERFAFSPSRLEKGVFTAAQTYGTDKCGLADARATSLASGSCL
jgi:hypothetical protein